MSKAPTLPPAPESPWDLVDRLDPVTLPEDFSADDAEASIRGLTEVLRLASAGLLHEVETLTYGPEMRQNAERGIEDVIDEIRRHAEHLFDAVRREGRTAGRLRDELAEATGGAR